MHPIEALVQQQVHAYNARDIERFLSFYAEDATLHVYPDRLVASGKAELRARYGERFRSSPNLHAAILTRMVMPPFVIDHEYVTGLPEGKSMDAIVIYEIGSNGLIIGARAMAPQATGTST